MQQTISIIVSGKVQGVFFRQSAKEKAGQAGITGKVLNTTDGEVAITATGTREQLKEFVQWCRVGPSRARVTAVEIAELPLQQFAEFSIIRS